MAEEPDTLVLQPLRTMRAETCARFAERKTAPQPVRLAAASRRLPLARREPSR